MSTHTDWKLRRLLSRKITVGVATIDDTETEHNSPKVTAEAGFDLNMLRNEKSTDDAQLETFHRAMYPESMRFCKSYQFQNRMFHSDSELKTALKIFISSIVMFLAQFFAVMPLHGIWQQNPRRLRFILRSPPMLLVLIFMVSTFILFISHIKHLVTIGVTTKNFVGPVFFACGQCACILFVLLARKWPTLLRHWARVELILNRPPYEVLHLNLAQRVRLPAVIIIALSLIEHLLFQSSAIVTFQRRVEICARKHNVTGDASFDRYMQYSYEYAFQLLPYNRLLAIYVLLINGACTFVWNYMDLFIMMISKGLAYRFEQISSRVRKLEQEDQVPESTFVEIREHYVKMCELLERVDNALSNIILLSCVNNLYFVCCQLLNIFNKLRWPINYVYFWFSTIYLVGRAACVFLAAATINDESKSALDVLRRVTSHNWCIEVERLIFQMSTQTVALSGKKFYFLTRRLLFGMAGTIVTYELVLLQFDEPNRRHGLLPLCG